MLAFACVLGIAAVGCADDGSSEQPTTEASTEGSSPTEGAGDFEGELVTLCDRLDAATDAAEAAENPEEYEELTQDLLVEQRAFVQDATELEPPSDIGEGYERYVELMDEFVDLNEQSLETDDPNEQARIALDGAENSVERYEAREDAGLPASCPPGSGGEVYGYLFQTRANVACLQLGAELDQLGKLQATTETREDSAEMLEFMLGLATAHLQGIEDALPPQIKDRAVTRMLQLYKQRARAIDQMRTLFVEADEEKRFNQALQKASDLGLRADKLADSLGLVDCVNFIGLAST